MRSEHAMFTSNKFTLAAWLGPALLLAVALGASAQQTLTWEQVRLRFEQNNPTLLADKLSIDESRPRRSPLSCARIRLSVFG